MWKITHLMRIFFMKTSKVKVTRIITCLLVYIWTEAVSKKCSPVMCNRRFRNRIVWSCNDLEGGKGLVFFLSIVALFFVLRTKNVRSSWVLHLKSQYSFYKASRYVILKREHTSSMFPSKSFRTMDFFHPPTPLIRCWSVSVRPFLGFLLLAKKIFLVKNCFRYSII